MAEKSSVALALLGLLLVVCATQIRAARLGEKFCDKCGRTVDLTGDRIIGKCGHVFHVDCVKANTANKCSKCKSPNISCGKCNKLIKRQKDEIQLDCGEYFHKSCIKKETACTVCKKQIFKCGYCGKQIHKRADSVGLDGCKHIAHKDCMKSASDDFQCADCTIVDKCDICEQYIQDAKYIMPCEHKVHFDCLGWHKKSTCPKDGCDVKHGLKPCAYCHRILLPGMLAKQLKCGHVVHRECRDNRTETDYCWVCQREKLSKYHDGDRALASKFQQRQASTFPLNNGSSTSIFSMYRAPTWPIGSANSTPSVTPLPSPFLGGVNTGEKVPENFYLSKQPSFRLDVSRAKDQNRTKYPSKDESSNANTNGTSSAKGSRPNVQTSDQNKISNPSSQTIRNVANRTNTNQFGTEAEPKREPKIVSDNKKNESAAIPPSMMETRQNPDNSLVSAKGKQIDNVIDKAAVVIRGAETGESSRSRKDEPTSAKVVPKLGPGSETKTIAKLPQPPSVDESGRTNRSKAKIAVKQPIVQNLLPTGDHHAGRTPKQEAENSEITLKDGLEARKKSTAKSPERVNDDGTGNGKAEPNKIAPKTGPIVQARQSKSPQPPSDGDHPPVQQPRRSNSTLSLGNGKAKRKMSIH